MDLGFSKRGSTASTVDASFVRVWGMLSFFRQISCSFSLLFFLPSHPHPHGFLFLHQLLHGLFLALRVMQEIYFKKNPPPPPPQKGQ